MRCIKIILLLILLVLINSCDKVINGVKINNVPDWYPMHLVTDEFRLTKFDSAWTVFIEENKLDVDIVKVDSLVGHLYKLNDYGNQFQLCVFDDFVDKLAVFKKSAVNFCNEWHRLVSIEPIQISSMDCDEFNGFYGAEIYIKSFYLHPLYNGNIALGSVGIRVNGLGKMNYLRSTLIPQLRVPEVISITKSEAKFNLSGYHYIVYSHAGAGDRVLSTKDIDESTLEVYIHKITENGNVIRYDYHLSWRFTTFDGDFFVDSQTGEVIDFIQGWK